MKHMLRLVMTTILVVLCAYGAPLGAQIQTRPWSAVGSTCAPDDDAPYTRYEVWPSNGYIEFKSGITGTNYFTCNVTTPVDEYPDEPDWVEMVLTAKDPDANGFVEAKLVRKNLATGAVGTVATVTSTDGVGVRETSVAIPALNFDTYAYFVRIRMYRSNTSSDQEFHIVRLQFNLL
jgi:hypothetical protein